MRLGDFSLKLWVVVRQMEFVYEEGGIFMCVLQAVQNDLRKEKETIKLQDYARTLFGTIIRLIKETENDYQ